MRILAFIFMLIGAANSATADTSGYCFIHTIIQQDKTGTEIGSSKYKMCGTKTKMRMDPIAESIKGHQQASDDYMIMDLTSKEMITVTPAEKTYMVFKADSAAEAAATKEEVKQPENACKYEQTTTYKTIAGAKCRVWQCSTKHGDRGELCISETRQSLFSYLSPQPAVKNNPWGALPKTQGMILEGKYINGKDGSTTTIRYSDGVEKSFADSFFMPPNGYKKIDMTHFTGLADMYAGKESSAKKHRANTPSETSTGSDKTPTAKVSDAPQSKSNVSAGTTGESAPSPAEKRSETGDFAKEVGTEVKDQAKDDLKQKAKDTVRNLLPW